MNLKSKINLKLKPFHIIAISFLLLILAGACLLAFPISSSGGNRSSFLDCFFTATSASCVTGLAVFDTGTYWSTFGQIVIITLIQIGGIGFMTFATLFTSVFSKKITLKQKGIIRESVNINVSGGLAALVKRIICGTVIIEGIGAVILSVRFSLDFGIVKGIYYGIFHSISAFCNAGFDVFGKEFGKFSSLTHYKYDLTVNLTVALLIIIGGIGFLVWEDILKYKLKFKKYSVQSKIVLVSTVFLLFLGTIFFIILESHYNNEFIDASLKNKVLMSFFHSSSTRTAGFNSVDIAGLSTGSKLITIILMFIGGSPGSTAGGIKTTTFIVLVLSIIAAIKGTTDLNIFKRRLESDAARKASAVALTNLSLAIFAAVIISMNHNFMLEDIFIETFSAVGTVGLSTGITRSFTGAEKMVLCLLMYCGRIGSLSFIVSFTKAKAYQIRRPETKIGIG